MIAVPDYARDTLADLLPGVATALQVPGLRDRLGLAEQLSGVSRVAVLLVDGLGARQLAAHTTDAPVLADPTHGRTISTCFPSTTAVSLSSLGTGLTPGEHGTVGYLMRIPGHDRVFSPLSWRLHGPGEHVDMRTDLAPETAQPNPTVFETAAADGVAVTRIGPGYQGSSGLTRAVLRGGEFAPAFSIGDLAAGTVAALAAGDRSLVYAYHGDLDLTGHARGPDSPSWRAELTHVDLLVRQIVAGLPADAALVVTADHGMVTVTDPIDLDAEAVFAEQVAAIGGEPRARHVYTAPGAAEQVAARWADRLGGGYRVLTGEAAIEAGLFGPTVTATARQRIGEVISIAAGDGALMRRDHEPVQSRLIGHHGALTATETEIPLLVYRP